MPKPVALDIARVRSCAVSFPMRERTVFAKRNATGISTRIFRREIAEQHLDQHLTFDVAGNLEGSVSEQPANAVDRFVKSEPEAGLCRIAIIV